MAYYYINKNPQPFPESGEHEIHRGDRSCSKPPLPENRIELGHFDNCADAAKKARQLYPDWKIDGCELCNWECHKI